MGLPKLNDKTELNDQSRQKRSPNLCHARFPLTANPVDAYFDCLLERRMRTIWVINILIKEWLV
jgi:hypothetical protein